MSIIYTCIAKAHIILADLALEGGNFQGTALSLASPVPVGPLSRDSIRKGRFNYYILFNDGISYICATELSCDTQTTFAFLDEVCKVFVNSALIKEVAFAQPFEFSRDLQPALAQYMADYGAQTGSQKLEDIQVQVNDVKGILKDNIDKVLDRGEKLDDLIDKTEDLQATADTFQKTATRVSRKMWWKNTKMIIIIVVIVVIILILIILLSTNVIPT
ncbi:uncharacterized protein LOC136755110 [Amia ocellicauda]|uniref:uncharacterized protein LOC136755110 n=1 Tax=Amia ocellicauda TaxID=2972642 RepID=UPI0034640EF0